LHPHHFGSEQREQVAGVRTGEVLADLQEADTDEG
jgi:hypothetical protein